LPSTKGNSQLSPTFAVHRKSHFVFDVRLESAPAFGTTIARQTLILIRSNALQNVEGEGKIGLSAADLLGYLWHLLELVNRHSVERIEVKPQTVQGNKGIVGESAATFRGGGFVSIASNVLSDRDNFPNEAEDLGHGQLDSPASTPLIE